MEICEYFYLKPTQFSQKERKLSALYIPFPVIDPSHTKKKTLHCSVCDS
jgi:hypothetical protein